MRYVLHEVRTPLAQIIGYSEMLQDEARDRGQDGLVPDLEQIRASAQQLLDFVESVFRPDVPAALDADGVAAGSPAPLHAGDAMLSTASPDAVGRTSGSLLIVDDEARNRDLLVRRLSRLGYDVTTAADGHHALQAIEAGAFDLVLLDVVMPGASGLEVLETIRGTRSASELPVIMATALGASEDTVKALRLGANDYVTKPFDFPVLLARVATQLSLRRASQEVAGLAQQLEIRNAFIRRMFGRYVSDEVVSSLLDEHAALELRGEMRRVTILMSDLRGFSGLTESLTPIQVVSLLNGFLGAMAEVIQCHGGTIDEIQGDAVLAFFGAPVSQSDDAERAVAAAVAMQFAIEELNARHVSSGLPEIEMGIGIATGDVIVGNLGSEQRAKYGAVGAAVNLASRIESYSLGGEVLVEDATREAIGGALRIDSTREVFPKGSATPVRIHRVRALGNTGLPDRRDALAELRAPIPLRFAFVDGKDVASATFEGEFRAISASGARLQTDERLPDMSDIRIDLLDESNEPLPGAFYAKVVAGEAGLVQFTTRSPALELAIEISTGS